MRTGAIRGDMVIPLRRIRAVPLAPADEPRATVISLDARRPPTTTAAPRTWLMRRRPTAPHRQGIRGHHPDCPYPTRNAEYCPICQGVTKGTRS